MASIVYQWPGTTCDRCLSPSLLRETSPLTPDRQMRPAKGITHHRSDEVCVCGFAGFAGLCEEVCVSGFALVGLPVKKSVCVGLPLWVCPVGLPVWVVLFRDRNAVMSHSEGLARRRRDYPGQVRSAARRTPHGVAPRASRPSLRRNPVGVRRRGEHRRSRVCPPEAGQPFAMRRSRFAAGTRMAFALLNGDESAPLVPRYLRFPKMFTAVVHSPVRLLVNTVAHGAKSLRVCTLQPFRSKR